MRMNLIYLLIIIFGIANAHGSDLKIEKIEVTYDDNVTHKGKVIKRPLLEYSDDDFWSKPDAVNVSVVIKNLTDKDESFLNVVSELYLLVQPRSDANFQDINVNDSPEKYRKALKNKNVRSLKSITDKPVWIYNRTLGEKSIRSINANQKLSFEFKNVNVANPYYPEEYSIIGFAIRTFVNTTARDDINYGDNAANFVILYPE